MMSASRSALLAALVLVLTVQACEGKTVVQAVVHDPAEDLYWTTERMASAKPLPLPIGGGKYIPQGGEEVLEVPGRTTNYDGYCPPGVPQDESFPHHIPTNGGKKTTFPENTPASGGGGGGGGEGATCWSTNNTLSPPSLYTTFPWCTTGKLFFDDDQGVSYYCTATAVSRSVVASAAHCVYDVNSQRWYRNWRFAPGFNSGNSPYGTFSINSYAYDTDYIPNNNAYYDFVFFTVAPNSQGNRVGDVVGWWGTQFTSGSLLSNTFRAQGYPGPDPYYGNVMYYADAEFCRNDVSWRCNPACPGVNMTRLCSGCSGGPWISTGSSPYYMVAVNSHSDNWPYNDVMYSAPYGTAAQSAYNAAQNLP